MSTQPPVTPSDPTATLQHLGLTLEAYADAKKLPIEFLKDCGLRTQGSTVRVPYFGIDGRESNAVRYRSALEGKNRFKWGYGSKSFLYGLDRLANARTHGSIVIVEGESDCHTLWHHAFLAVGVPGATSFKAKWLTHFAEINTLYIVIEPDAGGEQMLGWIAKQPQVFKDRVQLVRLSEQKDPSALHLDDSDRFKSRFREALKTAEPWAAHEAQQREALATDAWAQCEALAHKPDILHELNHSLERCGMVGERRAASLVYLAVTNRVLDAPVSICVKGPIECWQILHRQKCS